MHIYITVPVCRVQATFFAQCNMTERDFEQLLMKYQDNEQVRMAFMQLQYATQAKLQQRMTEGGQSQVEELGEEEY